MKEDPELDHLSTTSQDGKRIRIFPLEVRNGIWANRRKWVQLGLIFIYLTLPWLEINGHPILLLDVIHRRFSLFGKLFFAHEVPNLVFITLSFLLFMGLISTLFGRAWCGWTCPQTVFIEGVFRKIESWIEGTSVQQMRLFESPWTPKKILKKTVKWLAFTGVAVILTHSFLAYFIGVRESWTLLTLPPSEHRETFIFALVFGGILLFDFGWFREQFCLIACPYGRMQSVMMDEGSLFMAYDENRGDCIDCLKCVRVCPVGIDVRNGLQIECIACTACIDACDSVMDRLKKPKNLIGFGSILSLEGEKSSWLRGRVVIYLGLLAVALSTLSYRLSHRQIQQTEIIRAVDIPYQQVREADGTQWVINHYKIRFYNLDWNESIVAYSLEDETSGAQLIRSGPLEIKVESGHFSSNQFFLKVPLEKFSAVPPGKIRIQSKWKNGITQSTELGLVGPERGI